jgi:hypothetical protein
VKSICFMPLFILAVLAGPVGSVGALDPVRQKIIDTARQYVGVPYVYGAASPSGFDCSGFVGYVYGSAGISLPRTSRGIWTSGQAVRIAAAQPGDIIVFDTTGGAPSHVAILLDNETMIHAVSSGPRTGVIVSPMGDRYFAPRIMGMRSFIEAGPPVPERPEVPAPGGGNGSGTASAQASSGGGAEPLGIIIPAAGAPVSTDRIPIARGSTLRFTLTNGSGRDGVFEILFYKADPDPARHVTISRGRIPIKNNEIAETPSFTLTENGQYRLIIKTQGNRKLVEKTWQVVDL